MKNPDRQENEELKKNLAKLESSIESLEVERNSLKAAVANSEQEHISLQILTSEKDELIEERNSSIEKLKKKNEKYKGKLYELVQMNEGLDNRVTVTELKYFNLEKELTEKQNHANKLEADLNAAEKTKEEVKGTFNKEIEKLQQEKKEVEDLLEKEKLATENDKAEIQKTKKFLLDQIAQIKKKSNDKIQLNVDAERKTNQKQKVNQEKEIEMETIEII